jgi:predicted metalloprotease with PDZ domain
MRIVEREKPPPAPGSRAKTAIALVLAAAGILTGAFTLGGRKAGFALAGAHDEAAARAFDEAVGATVEPLDPATADSLGISRDGKGLVVTSLGERGPAARAGIRPGDVIERIGQAPVASPQDAASALRAARAEIILTLNRRGHYAIVRLPIRPPADFARQGDER